MSGEGDPRKLFPGLMAGIWVSMAANGEDASDADTAIIVSSTNVRLTGESAPIGSGKRCVRFAYQRYIKLVMRVNYLHYTFSKCYSFLYSMRL